MRLVYRGKVFPWKQMFCCKVNQVYCIFLNSSLQYHLNGRLKLNTNWIFFKTTEWKAVQFEDDVAQLEKTYLCIIYEGNRFAKDTRFDQKKQCHIGFFFFFLQWTVCSTLIYFIHLEALLWNWLSVESLIQAKWMMLALIFTLSDVCHLKTVYWTFML